MDLGLQGFQNKPQDLKNILHQVQRVVRFQGKLQHSRKAGGHIITVIKGNINFKAVELIKSDRMDMVQVTTRGTSQNFM